MPDPKDIPEREQRFKAEVRGSPTIHVIRRYVLSSDAYVFGPNLYFELQSAVADHFRIHPSEVLVVGSAQLGFSIAPTKRYQPFHDESDIDVVIISSNLFDDAWFAAFEYWRANRWWPGLTQFQAYLFRGWIRPDKLPPASRFTLGRDWWEFFRRLTATGRFGPYKISGALYRTWSFLEAYQSICVEGCRQGLVEER